MILVFWMLSFKSTFSLSSFTFIKSLFSFSLLSTIRVVSSAYLRLLIFLPAILIPAYASSSLAFCLMYSAYMLNKQGDNVQSWCTPFLIWNQSDVPRPVLTVSSWPAYRFLRRQVRRSGIPISWRIFQFVVIHTVKGFGIVNKEVDVFLELSCFFYDPTDVGSLTSGSTAFSKSNLNIWKFIVHVLLKPGEGNGKPLQCSCSETPWTEEWLSMTILLFCCRFFTKSLWVWTAYIHNFLENRRVNCPCCKSFCPFSTLHEQLLTIYPIICLNISWNDFTNETKWAVGFFVSPFILIVIRC